MKKIISVICAVVLLVSSFAFSVNALTADEAKSNLATQNAAFVKMIKERIDVDNSGKIQASDARLVLLASAGLNDSALKNKTNADIDGDGKITAIDARTFLRIAASLEPIEKYLKLTNAEKYNYFLAIINSIKPGTPRYYSSVTDETKKINYKDPDNVVGQINDQVRGLGEKVEQLSKIFPDLKDADLSETKNFDFAQSIKEAEGKKQYVSFKTASTQTVQKSNYPVIGNELACLLDIKDIKSVKYETNQVFTYEKIKSGTNVVTYTESVSGLDAITVYVNDDKAVSLTGDISGRFDNLTVNKAFDTLSEAEIKNILVENATAGDLGEIENMKEFGTIELNVEPKTLQYKDSYIKVYFDPATGTPVGTVHNLGYAINMKMTTFVDISFDIIKIFNVSGTMEMENVLSTETKVYLYETNPDHVKA